MKVQVVFFCKELHMTHCPECRHIMPSGNICKALALRGKPFCYFHDKLHTAARKRPDPRRPVIIPMAIEDRCTIQVAVAQVLRALIDDNIDNRRASILINGLRLASHNVDRTICAIPPDPVEDIAQTPEGDVIALPQGASDDCRLLEAKACDKTKTNAKTNIKTGVGPQKHLDAPMPRKLPAIAARGDIPY
jgi:hypothetical protein